MQCPRCGKVLPSQIRYCVYCGTRCRWNWGRRLIFVGISVLLAAGSIGAWLAMRSLPEAQRLDGHTGWVYSAAFSPDGRWVVSGSEDWTIRVWEVASGREVEQLAGHTGTVYSVAFSPDGRWVVSASRDRTVRVWEVASRREVQRFVGYAGEIRCVAFSPDGQLIST